MTKIRTAVIGVGYHGRHHARILSQTENCELVAVVDANAANCRSVAESAKCAAETNYRSLFGRVDAVVVATPTVAHFVIASEFLKCGVATLVEKPLAYSIEESAELVRLAAMHAAILQVGHIERFNPAFQSIERAGLRPNYLEFRRYSRFPFRSLDVSVVFDVMIHDIDLALALVDSEVVDVHAVGACVVSPSLDRVEARLQFANGTVAHIGGDRTHYEPVRRVRIWDRNKCIDADLQRRVVQTTMKTGWATGSYPPTLTSEEKSVLWNELLPMEIHADTSGVEPLRLELEDFLANVRTGAQPRVDGAAGLKAVSLASQIESLANGKGKLAIRHAA